MGGSVAKRAFQKPDQTGLADGRRVRAGPGDGVGRIALLMDLLKILKTNGAGGLLGLLPGGLAEGWSVQQLEKSQQGRCVVVVCMRTGKGEMRGRNCGGNTMYTRTYNKLHSHFLL